MLLVGNEEEYGWISWVFSTCRGATRLKVTISESQIQIPESKSSASHFSQWAHWRKGRILFKPKHGKGEKACLQQPASSGCVCTAFCTAQGCSGTESAAAHVTWKVDIHVHLPSGYQPKGAWNLIAVIQPHAIYEFGLTCRSCALRRLLQWGLDSSAGCVTSKEREVAFIIWTREVIRLSEAWEDYLILNSITSKLIFPCYWLCVCMCYWLQILSAPEDVPKVLSLPRSWRWHWTWRWQWERAMLA